MAFPEAHTYVSVIGDCFGASERWQFGFRIQGSTASSTTSLANQIGPVVLSWWSGTNEFASSSNKFLPLNTHRLTEVKVAHIGTDGKYWNNTDSSSYFPTPTAGATGPTGRVVPQATMAVTLTTAKPRGLASKGRFYPPPCAYMLPELADGRVLSANATSLANAVKEFINSLNSYSLVGNVSVYSRGKGVPAYDPAHNRIEYTYPNDGAVEHVTGVEVGRVIDTQRRRRRQLAEARVAVVI